MILVYTVQHTAQLVKQEIPDMTISEIISRERAYDVFKELRKMFPKTLRGKQFLMKTDKQVFYIGKDSRADNVYQTYEL